MEQPEGYQNGENLVCELIKGIHRLKPPPRAWFEKISTKLITIGFNSLDCGPRVLKVKKERNESFFVLFVK